MSSTKPPILKIRTDIIDTLEICGDHFAPIIYSQIESAFWRCAWLDEAKRLETLSIREADIATSNKLYAEFQKAYENAALWSAWQKSKD